MSNAWMPAIRLKLSETQFRQLPRNAAYRYNFLDGEAYLTPHPRHYHAVLDLTHPLPPPETLTPAAGMHFRPVNDPDWPRLQELFCEAFRVIQPFGSLDDAMLREASGQCLERTRNGGDGPLIAASTWVAVYQEIIVGATLVTLVPHGDPHDSVRYRWAEPPPDTIEPRFGRAHLTWIFVAPYFAGKGVGSALLSRSTEALRAHGFDQLVSTFVLGNSSSTLWHWRNGFALVSTSPRSLPGRRPPSE